MYQCSRAPRRVAFWIALLAAFSVGSAVAQSPDTTIESIVSLDKFEEAVAYLRADHERFVEDIIYINEIPAPSFGEGPRAKAYRDLLQSHGLEDVRIGPEGNAMGVRRGSGNGSVVAVLAHLDSFFPKGTAAKVRREGNKLFAPGVGDPARGLAVILTIIRALDHADIDTESDILFVGNVGEEGLGDLRGSKHLLLKGSYRDKIKQFVTICGPAGAPGQWPITNAGIGQLRYRVAFKGQGGHSFRHFGRANPANAMAEAISRVAAIPVPSSPKTTRNVGIVSGGSSATSIPVEVTIDVDMRSESSEELARLNRAFLAALDEAVAAENARASQTESSVEVNTELVVDRPAGSTATSSRIYQIAAASAEAFGLEPVARTAPSDANVPMSLGIPAIAIGPGHVYSGRSLEAWTDVDPELTLEANGIVLATVLGLAGVSN